MRWILPPGLYDRSLSLTHRGFADAAGKAKSQYYGADRHEKFLHEAPHQLNKVNDYSCLSFVTSAEKPHRRTFDRLSNVNPGANTGRSRTSGPASKTLKYRGAYAVGSRSRQRNSSQLPTSG